MISASKSDVTYDHMITHYCLWMQADIPRYWSVCVWLLVDRLS